jgi:hypothetical protein
MQMDQTIMALLAVGIPAMAAVLVATLATIKAEAALADINIEAVTDTNKIFPITETMVLVLAGEVITHPPMEPELAAVQG